MMPVSAGNGVLPSGKFICISTSADTRAVYKVKADEYRDGVWFELTSVDYIALVNANEYRNPTPASGR
jgi:hypothetical protein